LESLISLSDQLILGVESLVASHVGVAKIKRTLSVNNL
jgi:hypothetical protein